MDDYDFYERKYAPLSEDEDEAVNFARTLGAWQSGLWHVVNDRGYKSVEMYEEVAKDCARRWPPYQGESPFRAEPLPRPVLKQPVVERTLARMTDESRVLDVDTCIAILCEERDW